MYSFDMQSAESPLLQNFHCSYLLKGKAGQRIRLFFRDFDIYFGGEQ